MSENKTYAKNLTAGDWIVAMGGYFVVQHVHTTDNGWTRLDLSDGQSLDCLAYTAFVTV